MNGRLSWLGEYARIEREWASLMEEAEENGTDPTDNQYDAHDRAMASMASWAASEIASLQDALHQAWEAIERIEYAHSGATYVTGEPAQDLEEAIRGAAELIEPEFLLINNKGGDPE